MASSFLPLYLIKKDIRPFIGFISFIFPILRDIFLSMKQNIFYRQSSPSDLELIVKMISDMASFEKLEKEVTLNKEDLKEELFKEKTAQFIILEREEGTPIGYLCYYFTFSTFKGKKSLYIEDIFIYPEFRGMGYGKEAFVHLVKEAALKGAARVDWVCLNWNEKAQHFYESLGAKKHEEWLLYRLEEKDILALVKRN